MKLSGAQILMEIFREQQVDTVFGYPGGAVLNIYDELYKASDWLRHVITCHEQGASHAADGYARATGKTGVVLATSGPGATNLVTGIATAYLDSTPMVAITGNVACPLIGRDSFQEVDITGVTMPITKHNYMVKDVTRLADTLREAFLIAASDRPGPVLVDIPKDVQTAQCEFIPAAREIAAKRKPLNEEDVKRAAELISSAKRPFLYIGGGVVAAGAGKELLTLAQTIGAPIGASMMGLSAVPHSHPLFLGMTGMHGRYAASKALDRSDLIIAVGTRFSDRATGNKQEFSKDHKVLHIDIDPAEISKNIPAYVALVADVKQALAALNALGLAHSDPEWLTEVQALKAAPDNHLTMDANVLNPQLVLQAVNKRLPPDSPVATDVGQHQMWVAQYYSFEKPRTLITSGGLGTMGFGMGAAMGACIGTGLKKTLLVTSDGSFHMNMNELATAVANQLPLIVLVLNNSVLGMVRQWQTMFFGKRYSNTTLNRPTDFCLLAQAFGAKGLRLETLDKLDSVLDKAFATQGPVVVDVRINRDEMVLPMIPPNGSIRDMILRG
ncbi:MAG TPA: biosynthetic-type acetolactate synthase large subunit [Candidatus Limiplasma sp.]|nr:biosynthetic-type acetolactate synthase large subunit [Candidatus Limiplasma sp.]HPS81005.1 biosynthetic-type acetolactate synthase large subunit [Candidatus Limiplasma sp.]